MYIIQFLISSSPTKLLHFSHPFPSHVLAFSQFLHRRPLSQVFLLRHRKGKDGCPRNWQRYVESTKGFKNGPVSCSQTKVHWKCIVPLAQKLSKAKGVPSLKDEFLWWSLKTDVKKSCSKLCSENWPKSPPLRVKLSKITTKSHKP